MNKLISSILPVFLGLSFSGAALAQAKPGTKEIPNRLIEFGRFEKIVHASGKMRAQRRLSEANFLKMMSEKDVVILDARTDKRYSMLHVRGAVNLPFTEFTEQSLAKVIPNKQAKILIYCNNNFLGNQTALTSKSPAASLNLSTFTSLMAYGYTNVYELGPLLDVGHTRLPFDGEHADLQKLLLASTDWRRKMEDRSVRYKFVRMIEGTDSPFAVFQETADKSAGESLPYQAEVGVYWNGGLLIEDAANPGKYLLGISRSDLHEYLRPKKGIAADRPISG